MYADRADEIISSHNSSKPLFLMVAFQVGFGSQNGHDGHCGWSLYQTFVSPQKRNVYVWLQYNTVVSRVDELSHLTIIIIIIILMVLSQAPHNPFNRPPQQYLQPYRFIFESKIDDLMINQFGQTKSRQEGLSKSISSPVRPLSPVPTERQPWLLLMLALAPLSKVLKGGN